MFLRSRGVSLALLLAKSQNAAYGGGKKGVINRERMQPRDFAASAACSKAVVTLTSIKQNTEVQKPGAGPAGLR